LGFFDFLPSLSIAWGTSALAGKNASANIDGSAGNLPQVFGYNEGKVNVTEDSVLGLSAVFACRSRITSSIASLPWDVLTQSDERTSLKAKSHPCYNLLHTQPHPLYGSTTFRRTLIDNMLDTGNGFAEIQRDGLERPVALKIWKRKDVSVYKYDDRLYYKLTDGRTLQDYQMIHIKGFSPDGLIGISPVRVTMEAFRMGMQTQSFGNSFYENGTRLSGMMSTDKTVSDASRKNMRMDWEDEYGAGAKSQGKTAFLSDGWKYQQIGIAPDEAQFLDTRKFSRTEICAIYGVPPHMIMDLENATFSNIENQNRWYVTHTLMPIITNLEEEFNRKLFYESEQGTFYNKINVGGLLRGDTAAQTAHIQAMVDRGVYSRNEARAFLDMNPYKGGDEYLVQGAMTPADILRPFYETKIKNGDTSTPANA
jgi:HK97 family phage portal protein